MFCAIVRRIQRTQQIDTLPILKQNDLSYIDSIPSPAFLTVLVKNNIFRALPLLLVLFETAETLCSQTFAGTFVFCMGSRKRDRAGTSIIPIIENAVSAKQTQ